MKLLHSHSIILLLLLLSCKSQPTESTQHGWPSISNETRPWTRWWWHGSTVTKEEITRELQELKDAGIGGVEITPIYGVYGKEDRFVPFLSEDWVDLLTHTLSEAERLGLGVDMATGTGWPFGGPWVNENDACKNLRFSFYEVDGKSTVPNTIAFREKPFIRSVGFNIPDVNGGIQKADIKNIQSPIQMNRDLQKLAIDQIRFEKNLPLQLLMAYGANGERIDLTKQVDGSGRLTWQYPGGKWTLFAIFQGWHGKMVERAGPGGEGNVIDHFSHQALENYLQKFDSTFSGKNIQSLRAFFNDSYEVDDAEGAADWTTDFLTEFKTRRGYDLKDHLVELLSKDSSERNERVLCDYRETLSELLLENFTKPWKEWAHGKDALVRNQAHGSPSNILDLYSTVDIPEIEGIEPLRIRMASSAGNVTGKKLVSAEAATWLDEHFQSTLSDVKDAVDRFLLNGVNHIVYHGTAYSPADEPWPGWLFYAAVHFNSRNPFWKDFKTLNDYVARCQSFLQNTSADNDILLYYPIYDRFSSYGPEMIEHFDGIGKQFEGSAFARCAETLLEEGYAFDYISDKQIRSLKIKNDLITTEAGTEYKTIVIPACKYIPLRTLQKIDSLSNLGAKIIFFENLPQYSSGLANLEEQSQAFRQLINKIKTNISADRNSIVGNDIRQLLDRMYVLNEPIAQDSLQYIRKKEQNGTRIYFVNNTSTDQYNNWIELTKASEFVEVYNPMTGLSGKAKTKRNGKTVRVYVQLKPKETLILKILDDQSTLEDYPFYESAGEALSLEAQWKIEFTSGGPTLPKPLEVDSLVSWTTFGKEYEVFSGSATYSTSFKKPTTKSPYWKMELGMIKESAQIILNGTDLGTIIGPDYSLVIEDEKLQPQNELQIIVSNSMANRIADLDKRQVRWKKFYNINFPSRKPENRINNLFNAASWEPMPSGLPGPVTLIPIVKIE